MKKILLSLLLVATCTFAQTIVSVTPNTGNLGEQLTVTITGNNTTFLSVVGTNSVNFFNGASEQFVVNSVTPVSNTILIVDVTIPATISTGFYNLLVASTFSTAFMDNAFNVGNLATSNFESKANVSLWPNPAADKFVLELPEIFIDGAVCTLHDMQGRKVMETRVYRGPNQIDVVTLSNGTYVLNVSDGSKSFSKKLIIK